MKHRLFAVALWLLTTLLMVVCTYAASVTPAYAGTRVMWCYADGPKRLPHEDVACYYSRIKHPHKYDVHFVRTVKR